MRAVRIPSSFPRAAAALSALAVTAFPVPPALPPGGSYAPLGEAMLIQGLPVSAWVFDAPGTVPDIASWMTARQPALRDMWVMPGAVVLAGMAGGMHWTARLFETDGRTRGTISVLTVENGMTSDSFGTTLPFVDRSSVAWAARASGASTDPAWVLKGGRLSFEVRTRDEGATVIEQVWTHDLAPADLSRRLARDLALEGWRQAASADSSAAPLGDYWSRGRMSLSTVVVPLDGGSGVTAVMRIGM